MEDKWISVEDRLPELWDVYLCWNKAEGEDILAFNPMTKTFEYCDDEGFFSAVSGVTHWMELPDPPKGEPTL